MYSYHAINNDGSTTLSPQLKTIKALRERYFRQGEVFKDHGLVSEIVVFKGRKIHGYYTPEFKLDSSKPADIHNIFYGM
jgi:hypothetical protein